MRGRARMCVALAPRNRVVAGAGEKVRQRGDCAHVLEPETVVKVTHTNAHESSVQRGVLRRLLSAHHYNFTGKL